MLAGIMVACLPAVHQACGGNASPASRQGDAYCGAQRFIQGAGAAGSVLNGGVSMMVIPQFSVSCRRNVTAGVGVWGTGQVQGLRPVGPNTARPRALGPGSKRVR